MKQYLNISHMRGHGIPPVDLITFGSPCQGLSVAGARKGLEDERSNLFYEAIRVIEEMREETNGEYPRFAVWENVKGAFSSGKGEDFRAVLDSIVKLAEQEAPSLSVPPKGWPPVGTLVGGGWSIAWRTFDAQYWGVPQRRKRILLVADFRGESATEILFKQDGLSRDFATLPNTWEGIAAHPRTSLTTADTGCRGSGDVGSTGCTDSGNHCQCNESRTSVTFSNVASTLRSQGGAPKHNADMVGRLVGDRKHFEAHQHHGYRESETAGTLTAGQNQGIRGDTGLTCTTEETHSVHLTQDPIFSQNTSPCLSCGSAKGQATVGVVVPEETYCIQGSMIGRAEKNGPQGDGINMGVSFTLNTADRHAVCEKELYENYREDCRYTGPLETAPTIRNRYGTGGDNVPYVVSVDASHLNKGVELSETIPALQARDFKGEKNVCCQSESEKETPVYTLDRGSFNAGKGFARTPMIEVNEVCSTVISRGPSAVGVPTTSDGKRYRARRLTPTECARLQGFPDWWHDLPVIDDMSDEDYAFWKKVLEGMATIERKTYKEKTKKQMITWYNKLASDSNKYKMWGNGVALPMVRVPMRGIAQQGARTMGSLFDGSGGFPLAALLEGITPLWSSEVQPFPIAVTKDRFQERKTQHEKNH